LTVWGTLEQQREVVAKTKQALDRLVGRILFGGRAVGESRTWNGGRENRGVRCRRRVIDRREPQTALASLKAVIRSSIGTGSKKEKCVGEAARRAHDDRSKGRDNLPRVYPP